MQTLSPLSPPLNVAELKILTGKELLKWGKPDLIKRQLYQLTNRPWSKEGGRSEKVNIDAMLIERAVDLLPIVHRISVLMRSMGIFKTCQLLPLTASQDPNADRFQQDLEKLAAFENQIAAVTDGVIRSPHISPYVVLRMTFFAILERWKGIVHEKDETFQQLKTTIQAIFQSIDMQIDSDAPPPELDSSIASAVTLCRMYQSAWTRQGNTHRAGEADKMIRLLEALKKADDQYWLLMPCLLREIGKQYYDHAEENRLAPKEETWLQNFESAFRGGSDHALACLLEASKGCSSYTNQKSSLDKLNIAQKELHAEIANAVQKLLQIARLWREYKNHPVTDQRSHLSQLSTIPNDLLEARAQLAEAQRRFGAMSGQIIEVIRHMGTGEEVTRELAATFDSSWTAPWNHFVYFYGAILKDIHFECVCLTKLNEIGERYLSQRYISLGQVSTLNFLEMQISHAYLECKSFIKDENDQMKVMHDQLITHIHEIRDYYYQCKQKQLNGEIDQNFFIDLQERDLLSDRISKEPALNSKLTAEIEVKKGDAQGLLEAKAWQHLFQASLCLQMALQSRSCLEWLLHNPFASQKTDNPLENAYFCDLAMLLRRRFLQKDLQSQVRTLEKHVAETKGAFQEDVVQQVGVFANQLVKAIASTQDRLQNQPAVTPETLLEETRYFCTLSTKCWTILERWIDRCDILVQRSPNDTAVQNLSKMLSDLKARFQREIFSPVRALNQHCQELELIQKDEKRQRLSLPKQQPQLQRKPETKQQVSPKLVIASILPGKASSPEPLPKTIEGQLQGFETLCRQLAPLCQSFVNASTDKENVMRTRLQHESATNLLESLPILRELVAGLNAYGNQPFYAHLLYVKLAVLLEQAGILSSSILNIYRAPDDPRHALFMDRGGECFWQKHSPYQLAYSVIRHFLETKKSLILNKTHIALLQGFERTIAITSRRPCSGGDGLTDLLETLTDPAADADKRLQCSQNVEKTLGISLETGIKLLQTVHTPAETVSIDLTPDAIKDCCAPVAEIKREDGVTENHLDAMEESLHRLQAHLAIHHNRSVPAIGRFDQSRGRRIGTIASSLNDLQANLALCRSFLQTPEDPSLCLVLTESAHLQQAAILEQVLLIVLSYLPCRSSPDSFEHYLWKEENGKRPLRYRHAVEAFAGALPQFLEQAGIKRQPDLYHRTKTCAEALGEHLRMSYRYYSPSTNETAKLRDKMKALSILRDHLMHDRLSSVEIRVLDECLKIKDPSLRLSLLDSHISTVLKQQIKRPALQILELADEWLEVYEELLAAENAPSIKAI